MSRINLLSLLFMAGFITIGHAQEQWSLEKCISHAVQNSLTVKQSHFSIRNAELGVKGSQLSRLPSLNGSISGGYQFGRTIDPTTNDFDQQNIGFNSISLNSGVILYNGNAINNSIQQSKIDLEVAKLDAQASVDQISIDVANAYLNILLAEEQLQNANNRLEQSNRQLDQTNKLIEAGALPENDRLDILSQIALDKQGIVQAQNQVDITYLQLKQLLQLDPDVGIIIEKPEILSDQFADPQGFLLNEVYTSALGIMANIKANDFRLESATLGESIAKANLMPSVRLFGNINSNTSTVSIDPSKLEPSDFEVVKLAPVPAEINGVASDISFFDTRLTTEIPKRSYAKQFGDNLGQALQLSINIPIFNNYQNRLSVERARLTTLNQEVINQQDRQLLKANVQRAIADARAAKLTLDAANQSLEAAQTAYDNAVKRFDLGAINSLEFSTARNRLDLAQVDATQAKYQFIFNVKVVEFYQGKGLRLN